MIMDFIRMPKRGFSMLQAVLKQANVAFLPITLYAYCLPPPTYLSQQTFMIPNKLHHLPLFLLTQGNVTCLIIFSEVEKEY